MLDRLYIRFAPEEGQAMAEYALVLALVAVAVIVAVTALGGGISSEIGKITSGLP